MAEDLHLSHRWLMWRERVDLAEYNTRWDRLEAEGASVHDEATLVHGLGGSFVLDAGCGTGRVAAELARRGRTVVGVDNDADLLALAAEKPVPVRWVLADLATVELDDRFDVIVMAGDVINYVTPGREALVVANLARHLVPGGFLVSGQSLAEQDQVAHYDNWCRSAGLVIEERFASWTKLAFDRPGHYVVSLHRRSS